MNLKQIFYNYRNVIGSNWYMKHSIWFYFQYIYGYEIVSCKLAGTVLCRTRTRHTSYVYFLESSVSQRITHPYWCGRICVT